MMELLNQPDRAKDANTTLREIICWFIYSYQIWYIEYKI